MVIISALRLRVQKDKRNLLLHFHLCSHLFLILLCHHFLLHLIMPLLIFLLFSLLRKHVGVWKQERQLLLYLCIILLWYPFLLNLISTILLLFLFHLLRKTAPPSPPLLPAFNNSTIAHSHLSTTTCDGLPSIDHAKDKEDDEKHADDEPLYPSDYGIDLDKKSALNEDMVHDLKAHARRHRFGVATKTCKNDKNSVSRVILYWNHKADRAHAKKISVNTHVL